MALAATRTIYGEATQRPERKHDLEFELVIRWGKPCLAQGIFMIEKQLLSLYIYRACGEVGKCNARLPVRAASMIDGIVLALGTQYGSAQTLLTNICRFSKGARFADGAFPLSGGIEMTRRIALISDQVSPGEQGENKDPATQSFPVAQLAPQLAWMGFQVDVFTSKQRQDSPEIYDWLENVRFIRVLPRQTIWLEEDGLPGGVSRFAESMQAFFHEQGRGYDLIHTGSWFGGGIAARLKATLGIPFVVTVHELGRAPGARPEDLAVDAHSALEICVIRQADAILAESLAVREGLISGYEADPTYIVQIPPCFAAQADRSDPHTAQMSPWGALGQWVAELYEDVLAVRRVTIPLPDRARHRGVSFAYTLPHEGVTEAFEAASRTMSRGLTLPIPMERLQAG